jgi:hypothetical protein
MNFIVAGGKPGNVEEAMPIPYCIDRKYAFGAVYEICTQTTPSLNEWNSDHECSGATQKTDHRGG